MGGGGGRGGGGGGVVGATSNSRRKVADVPTRGKVQERDPRRGRKLLKKYGSWLIRHMHNSCMQK